MTAQILIVDDCAASRVGVVARLRAQGYDVLPVANLPDCVGLRPDLALVDADLPCGVPATCRALRRRAPDLPVILMRGPAHGPACQAALKSGATDVVGPDDLADYLPARMRRALSASAELAELRAAVELPGLAEAPPATIAPARIDVATPLARALLAPLPNWVPAAPGTQPDLVVLGPEGGLLGRIADLRARAPTRSAALLVLADDPAQAALALDLGADDCVRGGTPEEVVLRAQRALAAKRQRDALRDALHRTAKLARRDALTGLLNRRGMDAALARTKGTATLIALDIDRFKRINDTHGHAAGDAVIAEVARRIAAAAPLGAAVARSGGEEFVVIVPERAVRAQALAERLRKAVAADSVPLPGGASARPTVSVGLATGRPGPALLARADAALYAAKGAGRNTVHAA